MTTRAQSIALLEQTHTFPAAMIVKAICTYRAGIELEVANLIARRLNLERLPTWTARQTPSAKYIAITVEPTFVTAEDVLDVYHHLRELPGVVLLL